MSTNVDYVNIVGYLVPGMSSGKQLGLDSVPDVLEYLTLLACFLLFDCSSPVL